MRRAMQDEALDFNRVEFDSTIMEACDAKLLECPSEEGISSDGWCRSSALRRAALMYADGCGAPLRLAVELLACILA